MDTRQKFAINNPLARADVMPSRGYWKKVGNWSTLLTVNK